MKKRSRIQNSLRSPLVLVPLNEDTEKLQPSAGLSQLLREGKVPEIRSQFPAFREEVLGYDPIHLLGVTGLYVLVWAGSASAERKPEYELTTADLEALQALLLTSLLRDQAPTVSGDLGVIWSRIRAQYFALVMDPPLSFLAPEKERLANGVRLHSAYYRNPYGVTFFKRMMFSIADEFDRRYCPRNRTLLFFFQFIVRLLEKIDERFSQFHDDLLITVQGDEKALQNLARRLAAANAYARAIYTTTDCSKLSESSLRAFCHNMLDASGSDLFMFRPDQLRALSPESSYDPVPDIERCSMSFGGLDPAAFEKISSGNPVWGRPFVRVKGNYFLFSFFTVLSFPFHLFLSVVTGEAALQKQRLEDIRAKYLEKEAEALLRKYLPGSQVFRNLFWFDGSGKRYETDVLASTGNRLLILEAKGGLLPDRARSGNFAKVKSFLKDGYAFAGVQAARLTGEIYQRAGGLDLFTEDGRKIATLTKQNAENVIAYSLTLEQLGTIANARRLFEDVEVINPSTLPAPPLMVAELSKVLEVLPDETYCLHYLERRHQLYRVVDIIGDELDIFSTYVMQGFSSLPIEGARLVSLLNSSFYLNDYIKNGRVVFPPSSSVWNTKYFDRVLRYVLERKPPNYLELAFAIIDTPPQAQETFEEIMKDMRSKAQKIPHEIQVGSLRVQGGLASHVLAGSVYGELDRESRNDALLQGLADAISARGMQSGLLIGRQLGFGEYAYSVILYLKIKDDTPSPVFESGS